MKKSLILLGFVFLLFACVESEDDGSDSNESDELPQLAIGLKTLNANADEADRFAQGEIITFEISITNNTTSERVLDFVTSQQYDFVLSDANGEFLWRWSDWVGFFQGNTRLDLAPGETRIETTTWDQMINWGVFLNSGDYILQGSYLGVDRVANTTIIIM